MFGDIGKMMKQAKELQENMADMQKELADMSITGSSGAGMVEVHMNGKAEMTGLKIDPSLLSDDVSIMEDLILAAHNDAKSKVETAMQDKMQSMTGGMQLPPGFPGM